MNPSSVETKFGVKKTNSKELNERSQYIYRSMSLSDRLWTSSWRCRHKRCCRWLSWPPLWLVRVRRQLVCHLCPDSRWQLDASRYSCRRWIQCSPCRRPLVRTSILGSAKHTRNTRVPMATCEPHGISAIWLIRLRRGQTHRGCWTSIVSLSVW